ncbi:hypothetical protein BJF80_11170 [Serinicoccus sp. CUA-874]|uniref:hypothetical protein n=1 Tax=Serinicoccus sp. CUA-874 TaxID=1517939 RepID=UPI000963189A|nr:hypothetical protein BJF80_11170 [Serinicoccus sp. CUA-874]
MAPDPISRQTARQSTWHEVCQAYHFVERADLTVVHEHMPPGTAGNPHSHQARASSSTSWPGRAR